MPTVPVATLQGWIALAAVLGLTPLTPRMPTGWPAMVRSSAGFSLTSSAFSQTLTSASGDLAAAMLLESAGLSFTPGSGVTSTSGTNVGTVNNWALSKAGASSVTIDGTFASTPGGWGWKYSLAAGAGGGGGAVSPAPRPRASRFASLINL